MGRPRRGMWSGVLGPARPTGVRHPAGAGEVGCAGTLKQATQSSWALGSLTGTRLTFTWCLACQTTAGCGIMSECTVGEPELRHVTPVHSFGLSRRGLRAAALRDADQMPGEGWCQISTASVRERLADQELAALGRGNSWGRIGGCWYAGTYAERQARLPAAASVLRHSIFCQIPAGVPMLTFRHYAVRPGGWEGLSPLVR